MRKNQTPKAVYQEVQARAQGRCEACKKAPDWRGLMMHHKKHRGMGGTRDPEVHSVSNIVAICGRCHSLEHGIKEV
jgi:hypothetical protein